MGKLSMPFVVCKYVNCSAQFSQYIQLEIKYEKWKKCTKANETALLL